MNWYKLAKFYSKMNPQEMFEPILVKLKRRNPKNSVQYEDGFDETYWLVNEDNDNYYIAEARTKQSFDNDWLLGTTPKEYSKIYWEIEKLI